MPNSALLFWWIRLDFLFNTENLSELGMMDYINMQTKNLESDRDTPKIGKILVFKFPNDFDFKN